MHIIGVFGNQRLGQISFYLHGAHTATEFRMITGSAGVMRNQRCNRDIAFAYVDLFTLFDVAKEFAEIVFWLSNISGFHGQYIG